MATSTVEKLVEQVRRLTNSEKKELAKMLLAEDLIHIDEEFTDEELAEIELSSQEASKGKWVDFDEHRKKAGL